MHYLVITTGSCGNCYIFSTGEDTIIIDDGVTFKKITEKMAELQRYRSSPEET